MVMVVSTEIKCPCSPDGEHDFVIGGREYVTCKYCKSSGMVYDMDAVNKAREILGYEPIKAKEEKMKSRAIEEKTQSATEKTETDKAFEVLPLLPSRENTLAETPAMTEPEVEPVRKKKRAYKPRKKPVTAPNPNTGDVTLSGEPPVITVAMSQPDERPADDIVILSRSLVDMLFFRPTAGLPDWDKISMCSDAVKTKWLEVVGTLALSKPSPD